MNEKILYELPEKRERFTKHFRMEGKGSVAAIYPMPVHYEEDGQWKEIDNRLELKEEDGKEFYRNHASAVKVRFAKDPQDDSLVTIEKGRYRICWGLKVAKEAKGPNGFHIREKAALKKSRNDMEEKLKMPHLKEEGLYEDILRGIDLSYVLQGERLKENITVKSREAAGTPFVFCITHKGLELRALSDGNYGLFDSEECVFEFVKPYMYDADDVFSKAVRMEAEIGDGESTLKIIPDMDWLMAEERTYPVVIDPMTETSKERKNIIDTYVAETYAENPSGYGSLVVGWASDYHATRALLKFKNLPAIDKGSIVYAAKMRIWQRGYDTYSIEKIPILAHRVTANWDASTVTWANQPGFDSTVLDYKEIGQVQSGNTITVTPIEFDVTKLVRDWYNTGINHGILLRSKYEFPESTSQRAYGRFFASDYPGTSDITEEQYPCGLIYYRNVSGLEDYQSYHEQPLGRSGSGYINDYTGNIVWVHHDMETSGSILPVKLSHVYNLSECDTKFFGGYGWRLSVRQELKATGITDYPYVYIDADGTKHYFYQDTTDGNKLKDEDGLGLVITKTSGVLYDDWRIMITKDNYTYTFGKDDYLRQIKDPDGNIQWYEYEPSPVTGKPNQLLYIEDSTGARLSLSYDAAGDYLTSVTDEIGRSITYTYDTYGNLQYMDYPDGRRSEFIYDTNHRLSAVKNDDGRKICYELTDDFKVPRVSRVYQTGDDGTIGRDLRIAYQNGNTTIFTEAGLDGSISSVADNNTIIYHFDNMGRPVDVIHDDGCANSFEYYSEGMKNNKLGKNGSVQKTVYNYLQNPCVDMNPLHVDNWYAYRYPGTTGDFGVTRRYNSYLTDEILRKGLGLDFIDVVNRLATQKIGLAQAVTLDVGTYTLSAYVSVRSISDAVSEDSGISIQILDESENILAKSRVLTELSDSDINGGWERLSATFTLSAQSKIRVLGAVDGVLGRGYFTGFQLEEGSVANKLNLVDNPGFKILRNSVPFGWGYSADATQAKYADDSERGICARLEGEIGKEKRIYQSINLYGEEGDVYSISGWAKGSGIPDKTFKLSAKVVYEDDSVKWHDFPFNPNVEGWQFVNGTFRTDDDSGDTKKCYKDIEVWLFFDDQSNTVLFDGIQLIRDDGNSYVYDNDGKLVSSASAAGNSSFVSDASHSLTKMSDISGSSFEYTYDAEEHLNSAKNSQGVRYLFQYDSEGSPISALTQGGRRLRAVIADRTYYIRELTSGNYLHVRGAGTASGTVVELQPFTGSAEQQWKLVANPDGHYLMVPQHAQTLCLHLKDGSNTDNAQIQVCTKNQSSSQSWKVCPLREGTYQISCKATDNKKGLTNVDKSTTAGYAVLNATLYEDDTHLNQRWFFEPVESAGESYSAEPEDGKTYAFHVRHSGQYMDVQAGGTTAGTLIQNNYYDGSRKQQFYLEAAEEAGYFYLHPLCAADADEDMVLAKGTPDDRGYESVCLAVKETGNADQMFRFDVAEEGKYYAIVCKGNERALDVDSWNYVPGSDLIMTALTVGTNKRWALEDLGERIESSMTYTASRKHVAAVTDSRGNVTQNIYDADDRLLAGVVDAKGNETSYTYDSSDRLASVSKTVDGENINVTYSYEKEHLKSIAHNGFAYVFLYDAFGNRTSTKAAGGELMRTEYLPHNGLPVKYIYGNGCEIRNEYDKKEQLTAQYWKESGGTEVKILQNTFDSSGRILVQEDLENGIRTEYRYDLIGRITGIEKDNGLVQRVSYDEKNRVVGCVQKLSSENSAIRTGYRYGEAAQNEEPGLIYGLTVDSEEKQTLVYDNLGRLVKKTVNPGTDVEYVTEYTYLKGNRPGTTTLLVESVKENGTTLYYTYDELGNITEIHEQADGQDAKILKIRYAYDSLGQMIREDNAWLDKTICYTYDLGGNMTSKQTYIYTTGDPGTVIENIPYTYRTSGWKDQLLNYAGETITYDTIGNPLTYRGMSMEWKHGRRLTKITKGTNPEIVYAYNQNGDRIQKTIGTSAVKYHVDGGKIYAMETGEKTVHFLYDQDGSLFLMRVNDGTAVKDYTYVKNLQGDVVGLIDSDGIQMVSYSYDSWGKLVSMTDTSENGIGTLNPFRYRGYCYDEETGFYYLKSRYYDSTVCRFINADGYISSGNGLKGYNMYAYCGNNPLNNIDSGGTCYYNLNGIMKDKRCNKLWCKNVNGSNISISLNSISESYSNVTGLAETAINLGVGMAKLAIITEEKSKNVGLGSHLKNINGKLDEISSISRKVDDVFTVLGYAGTAIEVGENAYDNYLNGESSEKIMWDMAVDTVVLRANDFLSDSATTITFTLIGGALGSFMGALGGAVIGRGVDYILGNCDPDIRRYFKSWVD